MDDVVADRFVHFVRTFNADGQRVHASGTSASDTKLTNLKKKEDMDDVETILRKTSQAEKIRKLIILRRKT